MRPAFHPRRYRNLTLVLLFSGVFLFVAIEIVKEMGYLNNDFFTFWLAGHMLWTGQNPYIASDWISGHSQFGVTWVPNEKFVYPLPLALFYAPLGYLSLYDARVTWVFLSEVMITLSVFALISLQTNSTRKYYIIPILAGVVLFRPTYITLFFGQISGLVLFLLVGVVYLWEMKKWLLGGMVLPLVMLKPSLGGPILIILALWLLIQKRGAALVGIAVSAFALMFVGMMLDSNWIIEYLAIGKNKMAESFGFSPTLWGLAAYVSGFDIYRTLFLGGAAISILLAGVFYLMWRKHKTMTPAWIASVAITTALLVTPYAWPYDQLLLVIPIVTIMMTMVTRRYPFVLTSMVFVILDLMAIALFIISARIQLETPNVLIPLVIFCALVFCIVPRQFAN